MLAGVLAQALDVDWADLAEEIGLWIPVAVINKERDDKPEGEEEFGNDVLHFSVKILSLLF